jgi:hypothetical protein
MIDATGKIVAPGYVEAHFHPWVLYNPVSIVGGVLPLGTTTIVADNLFFYMQVGPDGFAVMADGAPRRSVHAPLIYEIYSRKAPDADIANLAPLVDSHARTDDKISGEILDRAAHHLVRIAAAALRTLGGTGGVWRHAPPGGIMTTTGGSHGSRSSRTPTPSHTPWAQAEQPRTGRDRTAPAF